ncbi:MAG TPA: hypothetical protein VFH73_06890 [Polyangia bacterium]|nr:hypothetical protein [Polyangia bacterium]
MIGPFLRGLVRWLNPPQPPPRLTTAEAIEIARRHLSPDDNLPGAGAGTVEENGRLVWRVVTHAGLRGGHSQVYVDDQTGAVIRTQHVTH